MKRIAILGAGVAGTTIANRLARQLSKEVGNKEAEILLISNTEKHIYQPGFLFVTFNEKEMEHFVRPQKSLVHRNVTLIVDDVEKIDVEKKELSGKKNRYGYDYLVIATGSYPDFSVVPGMEKAAYNFYTSEGAKRLRDRLLTFDQGKVMIVVDVPHKCPVAPLEVSFMLDDYFRKKMVRDKVEIMYTYPIGRVHSIQSVSDWAQPEFEKRKIQYETYFNMESIDPEKKVVKTMDGSEHSFDLLIAIPSHKGAPVILKSGLGDEIGFIPTDRHTLKMAGRDDVYVIGDATNLPISKAGSTAHYEAEVLTRNLVNRVRDLPESVRYTGKVACFIESSLGDASYITFDYEHPPKPAEPSELIHWFKAMYNELYWLTARGLM